MEELIPIRKENSRRLVSARDEYKALDAKKHFTDWWRQNSKEFKEGVDFMFSPIRVNMPNGGTKQKSDFLMTVDTAKKIAMKANTKKGDLVRDYFIAVEKKLNMITNNQKSLAKPDSYMIEDPIKRAKRWIQERQAYEEEKKLTAKQAKQLKDQESDVVFSKAMLATNHACKIKELAADLTKMGYVIGQNQLYELLRLEHYISKHSTFPMGSKIKCGYFIIKHGIKYGHAYSQTMVTPKGQKNIINKCLRGKWDDAYQKVMANTLSI